MNVVARAMLTFQILTLLKKYLYRQSQSSKTWYIKCLALIAQLVRAFGMNPKVGGLNPSQVETFSVSKTLTLSQEYPMMLNLWLLLKILQCLVLQCATCLKRVIIPFELNDKDHCSLLCDPDPDLHYFNFFN